eukprot:784883_1
MSSQVLQWNDNEKFWHQKRQMPRLDSESRGWYTCTMVGEIADVVGDFVDKSEVQPSQDELPILLDLLDCDRTHVEFEDSLMKRDVLLESSNENVHVNLIDDGLHEFGEVSTFEPDILLPLCEKYSPDNIVGSAVESIRGVIDVVRLLKLSEFGLEAQRSCLYERSGLPDALVHLTFVGVILSKRRRSIFN